MGLHWAWPDAEIVGVDIEPQSRYPFDFVLADAMMFPLAGFDFIWASPPCQRFTLAGCVQRKNGIEYPDLIDVTRRRLAASGIPWVIENVPGAPVRCDFLLCGSQFGLPIVRHRLIECSFGAGLTPSCSHAIDVITICGHGTPQWMRKRRLRLGLHPNASAAVKKLAKHDHPFSELHTQCAAPFQS
jgi:DNA (cytosine-5)-methyltransferase 1